MHLLMLVLYYWPMNLLCSVQHELLYPCVPVVNFKEHIEENSVTIIEAGVSCPQQSVNHVDSRMLFICACRYVFILYICSVNAYRLPDLPLEQMIGW